MCTTPEWTQSEEVELSVSFNGQQFHTVPQPFKFEEEGTLFGEVANVKEREEEEEKTQETNQAGELINEPSDLSEGSSLQVMKLVQDKPQHSSPADESTPEDSAPEEPPPAGEPPPSDKLEEASRAPSEGHRSPDLLSVHIEDAQKNQYVLAKPKKAAEAQADVRFVMDIVVLLASVTVGGLLVGTILRLPLILGYFVSGVIVGPGALNLITQIVQVNSLAKLGVVFLLFSLGVEFSLAKVRKVQGAAFFGGVFPLFFMMILFCLASVGMATDKSEGIFVGAFVTMSSTAIIIKDLAAREATESLEGQIMTGILVVQDVVLGVVLAMLPQFNRSSLTAVELVVNIAKPLVALMGYCLCMWLVAVLITPLLFSLFHRLCGRELYVIGSVCFILSISAIAEHVGLSIEMGAFVAGLMCTQVNDELRHLTMELTEALREVLGALFFACIGLAIDPLFLWDNAINILGVFAAIFIFKTVVFTPLICFAGYSWAVSFRVSVALAHVGEFAFVLAGKGAALGIISRKVYLLLLGTTAVSLLITPLLLRILSYSPSSADMPGPVPGPSDDGGRYRVVGRKASVDCVDMLPPWLRSASKLYPRLGNSVAPASSKRRWTGGGPASPVTRRESYSSPSASWPKSLNESVDPRSVGRTPSSDP
eukprot:GHVS01060518.1.p1 GENE.GHVS01060518.1~~GHVS01060518.1.p1  ORF type:complete len:652 (+),score=78.70 GHVS01060518.1:810-2765(+)